MKKIHVFLHTCARVSEPYLRNMQSLNYRAFKWIRGDCFVSNAGRLLSVHTSATYRHLPSIIDIMTVLSVGKWFRGGCLVSTAGRLLVPLSWFKKGRSRDLHRRPTTRVANPDPCIKKTDPDPILHFINDLFL